MKFLLMTLLAMTTILPVLAQETNEFRHRQNDGRRTTDKTHKQPKRPEWTEQQRKEHQERRYRFMDKALSEIGVGEEDRVKIRKLQENHRQKMKANTERGIAARKKLSALQEKGATEEEIDNAIQEVADAMAEQLRILVRNRMEMEKILGKEKYALFMQNARKQFQKHGRRGGPDLPPRPGLPPIPGEGKNPKQPPLPSTLPPPPPAP